MKTRLLALFVAALATSLFAQGTVWFANTPTTLVTTFDGTPVPTNGGFVELCWALPGTTYVPWDGSLTPSAWLAQNAGWTGLTSSIRQIGPVPGRFLGATFTLPTTYAGGAIEMFVLGWTGNYSNPNDAYLHGEAWGATPAFTARYTGNDSLWGGPSLPARIFDVGFTGLTLFQVPEPSALALAALGTFTLLCRRWS